jgi:hypothetical protein
MRRRRVREAVDRRFVGFGTLRGRGPALGSELEPRGRRIAIASRVLGDAIAMQITPRRGSGVAPDLPLLVKATVGRQREHLEPAVGVGADAHVVGHNPEKRGPAGPVAAGKLPVVPDRAVGAANEDLEEAGPRRCRDRESHRFGTPARQVESRAGGLCSISVPPIGSLAAHGASRCGREQRLGSPSGKPPRRGGTKKPVER